MKKIKQFFIAILFMALVSGCESPEVISLKKLIELNENYKEPKVVICYYTGSDLTHHYFSFRDLGVNKIYKITKNEIKLDEFEVTRNRDKWIVMPWGVHGRS